MYKLYRFDKPNKKWLILGSDEYKEIKANCEVCGKSLKNVRTKLIHIDHIDRNHRNDKLSNLRLTCNKCNMNNKNSKKGKLSKKARELIQTTLKAIKESQKKEPTYGMSQKIIEIEKILSKK